MEYLILTVIVLLITHHYKVSIDNIDDYLAITYVKKQHTLDGYYDVTYTKKLFKIT
jgi:hypothetical protein